MAVGIIIGLFMGVPFGVVILSIMIMAKRGDKQ